ncbi:MAG: hypothetical protein II263_09590, partial [Lachnospiraceae bacterium]|nr:hypothetical protein [Lachnospiraceae bacterium]
MEIYKATFEDMALASNIMITSFRTSFADFVSKETMDACTNPENCRAMLEHVCQEDGMQFLMGDNQGFICWKDTEEGVEVVALHTL